MLAELWLTEKRESGGSIYSDRARRSDLCTLTRYIVQQQAPTPVETLADLNTSGSLAELNLLDLTADVLNRSLAQYGEHHALRSVHRMQSTWRCFCAYLHSKGVISSHVTPSVELPPIPRSSPKSLTLDDLSRLVKAAGTRDDSARLPWPERDHALLSLFLGTGVRPGEAIELRMHHLELGAETPTIAIAPAQRGDARSIVLPDKVALSLQRYLADRTARMLSTSPTSPLFVRLTGAPLSAASLNHIVVRWFRRAGVPLRHGSAVYALRHTYAALLLESGLDIPTLKEVLGHQTLSTTERYLPAHHTDPGRHVRANPAISLLHITPTPTFTRATLPSS